MSIKKVLAIIWSVFLIIISSMPGSTVREIGFMGIKNIDKIGHFLMYAGFTYLWSVVLWKEYNFKLFWMPPVVVAIILGVILEFLQGAFFSERSFEIADIVANTLGAVSVVVFFIVKESSNRKLLAQ